MQSRPWDFSLLQTQCRPSAKRSLHRSNSIVYSPGSDHIKVLYLHTSLHLQTRSHCEEENLKVWDLILYYAEIVKGLQKAQLWSSRSKGEGWTRHKTSLAIHMLSGNDEGRISCGQYSFNGKKWNPYLEIEKPIIICCKEALSNNLN